MSDCWELLGIQPSTDIKAIKRAYSKRLKNTRPDEDPAGFQQLYQAYQAAVAMANAGLESAERPADELVFEVSDFVQNVTHGSVPPNIVLSTDFDDTSDSEHQESLTADMQAEIKALADRLEDLLKRPFEMPNPDKWSFLSETPSLLHDDFRIALGKAVLSRIVSHENRQHQRKKHIDAVPGAVVTQLDDTFLWSSYPFVFTDTVDFDQLLGVLGRVDHALRPPVARPVGGEFIADHQVLRERDPAIGKPSMFSGLHLEDGLTWVFALIMILTGLARSCS